MLPMSQRIAFLVFALLCVLLSARGFLRVFRQIRSGKPDTDRRTNNLPARIWYAITTTLTQSRTFRKRPFVSFFHSFIFYGFVFYFLVNAVDAVDGFVPLGIRSSNALGAAYLLGADVMSALVIVGVIALVIRRFLLPSRRDFRFNERTLLQPQIKQGHITRDSVIVSAFILIHVGSRAAEMGAALRMEGADRFQPFSTLLSHVFSPANAPMFRVLGFWGALGSIFAFLLYFPYSKHLHIFMAPAKYTFARDVPSGVLPAMQMELDSEGDSLGAGNLEQLAWPRLLDAYACIQCNRCQDACPATATGKSLSPSALEINKRMELNTLLNKPGLAGQAIADQRPFFEFALTPEALWACTTCGACLQACPVQDEPMLDLIDIRRHAVMMEGSFPAQLQSAFRGMERASNPWGLPRENRLAWADGLKVKTVEENPDPDVLYWVGCAASYDPQAQKTARAMVQLMNHAGVNFSVLGKKECCTGDSARRAGNEYLYRQLAEQNISTLQQVKPKRIVASCPHCLNSVGKEYRQLGGDFEVLHHTQLLDSLIAEGKLAGPEQPGGALAFHDPCYLGRHNGVYDAPRNLLRVLSQDVRELERNRENSFCCGAGGAQFWKEEEPGNEKIATNRMREVDGVLANGAEPAGVLAVGCPFCKSMLQTADGAEGQHVVVKDVAELLWEAVGVPTPRLDTAASPVVVDLPQTAVQNVVEERIPSPVASSAAPSAPASATAKLEQTTHVLPARKQRRKWVPPTRTRIAQNGVIEPVVALASLTSEAEQQSPSHLQAEAIPPMEVAPPSASAEQVRDAKASAPGSLPNRPMEAPEGGNSSPARVTGRKKWIPKKLRCVLDEEPLPTPITMRDAEVPPSALPAEIPGLPELPVRGPSGRRKWQPKSRSRS